MRIDDEASVFGNPVIEDAAGCVGCMRRPVNATATGGLRRTENCLDEAAADAFAAQCFCGEEVLKVADIVQPRSAAVEEIVHQANNGVPTHGDKRVHGFGRREEALPRGCGDCARKGCGALAAIERVVAVSEWKPS